MIATFASAETTIAEYKQQQYQIVSNRKTIVQNNLSTLNDLYDQLSEILKIGKILYKDTDPVKKQEYTFSKLKKKVRHEVADSEESSDDETTESTPDTEK